MSSAKQFGYPASIWGFCSIFHLFLLLTSKSFGFVSAGPIVATFSEQTSNGDHRLQHLVVDKLSALVYVGGVNRLYQLSPELERRMAVETGPKEDSPECSAVDCLGSVIKKLTDNVNKALVIDYTDTRLIACGTLYQGICSVRNLKNISEELMEVREPVVANNSTATTVVFIAPGPPNPPTTHVLYVGVTYTGNSPYRSEVPAVSSRSLARHEIFQIANMEVTTGTRISVTSLSRDRYPIHYVYGFSSEGFSYFLTTQMRESTNNSPYISKLVRVCQDDRDYHSYTEVPLECVTENGTRYNLIQAAYVDKPGSDLAAELGVRAQDDVLFAVFAQSKTTEGGEMSNRPASRSALCVYSLKSIRRKFMHNIQKCFSGEGHRGLDFISPSLPCVHTSLQTIGEDFCGLYVNTPLGGGEAVIGRPVCTMNNVLLTAVAATSTGDFTVVFLGTSKGHLKKVALSNVKKDADRGAVEYDDITVDEGSRVSSDLVFDPERMHLYAMTERKVTKVRVQDCGVYKTCGECLRVGDPYCGWCSLENKCSLRSDCQDAAKDPLYWISYKSGRCTTITSVTPNQLQRTTTRTLSLVIDNLLTLSGQYQCAFSAFGKTLLTNATRRSNGLECNTPRTDRIPANPPEQHYFTAKLTVRMTKGPDFVATNFTFFDCTTYTSCTECVSSSYPCDWCVDGDRCTHDTAENCRNDILVTGVNRIGPSIQSGPGFCPRINATASVSTEILVSHGIKKSIKVKVENIAQFIVQTNFVCQFNIEGRVTHVRAQLLGDIIYCDDMEFTYSSRAPNITATFAVIWDGSKPLDNPDNVHVLIYRCREMADNCGLCLILADKYLCGWCQSTDKCEVREQCDRSGIGGSVSVATGAPWLDRDQICRNPEVKRFDPRFGPWEGGTNLTIEGVNLGKTFSDIAAGITVAGMPCHPYEELYVQTRRIVCLVVSPKNSAPRRGPVIVRVSNFQGESADYYEFVNPIIESIHPSRGPLSGGTQLTIRGQFLNAGSSIQAVIDPSLTCAITSINSTHAICRTSASNRLGSGKLQMSFDRGVRRYTRQMYQYVEDPIIEYAESGVVSQVKVPKGIPSGGIIISVAGNNFEYIQEPKIFVRYRDVVYSSSCQVLSNQRMQCRSPSVPVLGQQISPEEPMSLDYGFLMDDVPSVRNLSHSPNYPKFLLYPDPVYEKFDEEVKHYKSDYLTINGIDLDRACHENDVKVTIGTAPCMVTSLSRSQLTCRTPSAQPQATGSNPNDAPEVVVIVGRSLRYVIGKLIYDSPNSGVTSDCGFLVFVINQKTVNYFKLPTTDGLSPKNNSCTLLDLFKKINKTP